MTTLLPSVFLSKQFGELELVAFATSWELLEL